MNVFGRLLSSDLLKSETLTSTAKRLSDAGYLCQVRVPDRQIRLDTYFQENPKHIRANVILKNYYVLLRIENDEGIIAVAGDFNSRSASDEQQFLKEVTELLDFLQKTYQFKFGFIDKEGDTSEKLFQFIERLEIENLFYTNYFSKEWLHKHGEDYFLKAPGQTVVLEDGSIRYYPKKSIRKTEKEEALALKHYFNNVKIFNAKKSDDW